MLKDSRESDVTQYQVVDAETGDLITDVVAACEEEGWVLRGTHAIGSAWVCPTVDDRHVELRFRPIRIVPAPSAIPKAVGDPVDLFAQLLTNVTEEIAATCLQPDGTWCSSVADRLEMIARQHEDARRHGLASLDLRKCRDVPNRALDHAIEVTAYYDRVVNGIQEGYRGYITTERLLDGRPTATTMLNPVLDAQCLGIVHEVMIGLCKRFLSPIALNVSIIGRAVDIARSHLDLVVKEKRLVGASVNATRDPGLGLCFSLLPTATYNWARVVTWEEIAHAR